MLNHKDIKERLCKPVTLYVQSYVFSSYERVCFAERFLLWKIREYIASFRKKVLALIIQKIRCIRFIEIRPTILIWKAKSVAAAGFSSTMAMIRSMFVMDWRPQRF